ncbi:hypothetical protein Q3G72_008095 [Acer saccharum]|nr:hypothetical protein Q3G72_008095 [Acer saccharum]
MRIIMSLWLFLIPLLANLFCSHVVLVAGQCQSDQQSLLLQLKSSLKFAANQSVHLVEWNQTIDCCNWSGVVCDVGGRVTGLNLSFESISGAIENSTGLFGLQHLQRLDLAYNRFNGSQIPSRLANLSNLTYLNLSNAGFVGQIPGEVSNLTKLVSLDLSTLSLLGSGQLKLENPNLKVLVQNFRELRELYLDGVNLSGQGSEWCQALSSSSSLSNLQVLSLSSCFLSGPIHPSLADLHSLSVIRLDQNNLSTPVPEFMSGFSNLTSLNLRSCGLNGTFPEKIFQNLVYVDLRFNSFNGTLPPPLFSLPLLQKLQLSDNQFDGQLPEFSRASSSVLDTLDLSGNRLEGSIPKIPIGTQIQSFNATSFEGNEELCGSPLRNCTTNSSTTNSSDSQSPAAPSNEFDWQIILMGIGFGIGSGLVVAPIMFSKKVNRCCDNHIDKILMVILPMVGLVYTNSHQRRIQAEEFLENENTDEDEEEDYEFEPETEEFRGRYCVLCSKLDITRKKVIHDPNCTCHDSPPTSFSSTTSSASSSLAVLR